MTALIVEVLRHECFLAAPPVIVDIGASGSLPAVWQPLAPHSICIAFDADKRDFQVKELQNSGWKKHYSLNRLVAPVASASIEFYLTKSPHCSSSLRPDTAALKAWVFAPLFEVAETVRLPAVELKAVLRELNLDRVDWFKCDSQGTDLRIFKSLDTDMTDRTLLAEFEPGIIDSYQGEDKLHEVMAYMEGRPFWVSDMEVKGSQRMDPGAVASLSYLQRRYPASFLKTSPGWCEVTYLNTCDSSALSLRDCLLAWVFATIKGQHGFGARLAERGHQRFGSEVFSDLLAFSRAQIDHGYGRLAIDTCKRLLARFRR